MTDFDEELFVIPSGNVGVEPNNNTFILPVIKKNIKTHQKNKKILEDIIFLNSDFASKNLDSKIHFLCNASQKNSENNNEARFVESLKQFCSILNPTDDDKAKFQKETRNITHSVLQGNKSNAGYSTEIAVQIALTHENIFHVKHKSNGGIDILILDNTFKIVAAISVKRTSAERWRGEVSFKTDLEKQGENVPYCMVLQKTPNDKKIEAILSYGFHLFIPDNDFSNIKIQHPNLHLRSMLPDFLRSLGAATTR